MQTHVLVYDPAIDGGGVGVHLFRGPFVGNGDYVRAVELLQVTTFGFGAGCTLDIGIPSNPTLMFAGIDPSFFSTAPSTEVTVLPRSFHFAPSEPWQVTINNAPATGGLLELLVDQRGL